MKKCPKCSKTFDDDKRFCQVDGTPLVDDTVEPDDIYKTIVQMDKPYIGASDAPKANPTFSKPAEDDLLQIPQQDDPMKTMIAPSFKPEPSQPFESPKPYDAGMNAPSFGDLSSNKYEEPRKPDSSYSTPPVSSSPFDSPMSSAPTPSPFDPPPPYKEPVAESSPKPFDQPFGTNQPMSAGSEWAPPPAPVNSWENKAIDSNTPFNPPVAGVEGQNKTLAIVSLVCGILGVCLCGILAGIPALITGYMAKNNIDAQPQVYGGKTFALVGMALGGISIVFTILYLVYVFVMGGAGLFR